MWVRMSVGAGAGVCKCVRELEGREIKIVILQAYFIIKLFFMYIYCSNCRVHFEYISQDFVTCLLTELKLDPSTIDSAREAAAKTASRTVSRNA